MRSITCVLALGVLLLLTPQSIAEEIVLDAIDQGWFAARGEHTAENENTLTGRAYNTLYCRSFFVFDLTIEEGPIVAAELRLALENYTSDSSSEPFTVYDVDTTAAELNTSYEIGDPDAVVIYEDLGGGNVYATETVVSFDVGSVIVIPLSTPAVFDLNTALGTDFAVGLDLDSPDDYAGVPGGTHEFIRFSLNNQPGIQQLALTRQCTPLEVSGIRVHDTVPTTVSWTEVVPDYRYDVVGGLLSDLVPEDGVDNAECLEEDVPDPSFSDERSDPQAGEGYYYLVRAQLDCAGTYGYSTSGPERLPLAACF